MRSELEALSAGIDDFPSDLSSVFTKEESSKLENAAMDLSSVPEALVTIRAARDKMKGKSEGKGEPTTVKCSKGHVRHATSSEQLPLGPLLDALRAPLVPPVRRFVHGPR